MAWRILLLSWLTLWLLAAGASPSLAAAGDCGVAGSKLGGCSVSGSINDDTVVLRGSETSSSRGSGDSRGQQTQSGASIPPTAEPPCVEQPRSGTQFVVSNCAADPVAQQDAYTVSAPTITIDDLAAFGARAGTQRMEPDGFAVVGLPTNFYADTAAHVVGGQLLGQPADVRFTPVSWRWDYGDGTRSTARTRGSSWSARGADDFSATPTSHVFARSGTYRVTLSVAFGAEYRFADGGWIPVSGTVSAVANTLEVTAGSAKTVLVQQDCLARPLAPGC